MTNNKGISAWALLPVRLTIGLMFMAHGSGKLFGWFGGGGLKGVAQMTQSLGMNPPMLWAILLAGSEFFGGAFLFIGLLTRWATIPLIITMLVALFRVHLSKGFFLPGGFEYVWVILGGLFAVLIGGAGSGSLDQCRCKKP